MYPSSDLNLTYQTDDAIYFISIEHGYYYRKFSTHAPKVAHQPLGGTAIRRLTNTGEQGRAAQARILWAI